MEFVDKIKQKAKSNIKTIVLPEAYEERNLKAADRILSEGFAKLILIGNPEKVHHLASELYPDNIAGAEIVDPTDNPKKQQYVDLMLKLRASKGLTAEQAEKLIVNPLYLGALMVKAGDADGGKPHGKEALHLDLIARDALKAGRTHCCDHILLLPLPRRCGAFCN